MMRPALVCGSILALTVAVSGAAGQSGGAERPLTQAEVTVVRTPSTADSIRAYPVSAATQGLEGSGEVLCRIDGRGGLTDCSARSERPQGAGFAASAILLASQVSVGPRAADGTSTAGRLIDLRFGFRLPPAGFVAPSAVDEIEVVTGVNPIEMARLYPTAAANQHISASVTFRCVVDATGGLFGCQLTRESPLGFGFGEATLRLAQAVRVNPLNKWGQPVEGRTFERTLVWRME